MRCFGCIFLLLVGIAPVSNAKPDTSGTNDIIRSTLMDYFSPYKDISSNQARSIEDELLNTETDSKLAYPPFPRTWIERYSSTTQETTTAAFFDTGKIVSAISTLTGPLAGPVNIALNGAQIGFKREYSIKYSYNRQTTLMVMTSWRQLKKLGESRGTTTAKDVLESSVIDQRNDLRNYFKVSEEYPLLGMCKFEMSLAIQRSKTDTLSLAFGSRANGENVLDGMSYTVYSNFFQIEPHIPVEDYLHVRCGESFTEAVRFLVESEFNKLVTGYFAHYHPKSECRWKPPTGQVLQEGDKDCSAWFDKLNILGLDKKTTAPRCVLGNEGYPVCVVRSKTNAHCPVYAANGNLFTKEPERYDRQINPMDSLIWFQAKKIYECDNGLECRLDNGRSIHTIPLGRNRQERMSHLRNANYVTTCQPVTNRGGR